MVPGRRTRRGRMATLFSRGGPPVGRSLIPDTSWLRPPDATSSPPPRRQLHATARGALARGAPLPSVARETVAAHCGERRNTKNARKGVTARAGERPSAKQLRTPAYVWQHRVWRHDIGSFLEAPRGWRRGHTHTHTLGTFAGVAPNGSRANALALLSYACDASLRTSFSFVTSSSAAQRLWQVFESGAGRTESGAVSHSSAGTRSTANLNVWLKHTGRRRK